MLITDSAQLVIALEPLRRATVLALDTEFVRESTYYPRLCLIQITGNGGPALAIDMMSDDIDLAPLKELLENKKVLKLFHAGKQDLEILCRLLGFVPTPLFDTQVAAQLLGYGDQVGYEALVRDVLGKSLDKSQQYTNWARRPLSDRQLEYALNDVLFLRELYPALIERLKAKKRDGWMEELMQPISEPAFYRNEPEDAWRRLSRRAKSPAYLARLKVLAECREIEAEERNLPRQWIFTDETLQDLALHPPKGLEALKKIRLGKCGTEATYDGLIGALEAADPQRFDGSDLFNPPLAIAKESETLYDLLKLLLKVIAEEEKISPRLLATSEDLIEVAMGKQVNEVFSGWRYYLAGEKISQLLQGNLHIRVDTGKIVLEN